MKHEKRSKYDKEIPPDLTLRVKNFAKNIKDDEDAFVEFTESSIEVLEERNKRVFHLKIYQTLKVD
jgi:hypothetical protein